MIVAVFSGASPRKPGRNAPIAAIGTTLATKTAHALSAAVTFLARSSRKIVATLGLSLDLSRTFGEVTTCFSPRLVDGRVDDLLAGGIVQIHGDLAQQRRREVGERGGDHRRQEQPEVRLVGPQFPAQGAAQREGAQERVGVGEAGAGAVGDRQGAGGLAGLVDEGPGQRPPVRGHRRQRGVGPVDGGGQGGPGGDFHAHRGASGVAVGLADSGIWATLSDPKGANNRPPGRWGAVFFSFWAEQGGLAPDVLARRLSPLFSRPCLDSLGNGDWLRPGTAGSSPHFQGDTKKETPCWPLQSRVRGSVCSDGFGNAHPPARPPFEDAPHAPGSPSASPSP